MKNRPTSSAGFTLVELAIVLIIVALLINGLMVPISTQQDAKATNTTELALTEIREALMGYALINQKLPCPMPTSVTDPASAAYGVAGSDCSIEGILPWKSLGVSEVDAWGQKRSTTTDSFAGYWRYRLHPNFNATISSAVKPYDVTNLEMLLYNHAGNLLHVKSSVDGESPVAVVYSTGKNRTADGQNTGANLTYEAGEPTPAFDDQLLWISRPTLFSRLAAAGKL